MATPAVVESLLHLIRRSLYADDDLRFHRDRKRLVHAIAWTAHWMQSRGLSTSPKAYCTLLAERVAEIARHGEPERYAQYLPAYLLKTIQEHIRHHGDELYDKLKRIRNFVEIAELRTKGADERAVQQRQFIEGGVHDWSSRLFAGRGQRPTERSWCRFTDQREHILHSVFFNSPLPSTSHFVGRRDSVIIRLYWV